MFLLFHNFSIWEMRGVGLQFRAQMHVTAEGRNCGDCCLTLKCKSKDLHHAKLQDPEEYYWVFHFCIIHFFKINTYLSSVLIFQFYHCLLIIVRGSLIVKQKKIVSHISSLYSLRNYYFLCVLNICHNLEDTLICVYVFFSHSLDFLGASAYVWLMGE